MHGSGAHKQQIHLQVVTAGIAYALVEKRAGPFERLSGAKCCQTILCKHTRIVVVMNTSVDFIAICFT